MVTYNIPELLQQAKKVKPKLPAKSMKRIAIELSCIVGQLSNAGLTQKQIIAWLKKRKIVLRPWAVGVALKEHNKITPS